MAEDKRFYWVKLDYRRFETGGDLDFLMGQKGGAEYVVLYMMLCLNTRNTQGVAVMTLKKNKVLERAVYLEDSSLQNPSRYRVRSLPAAGAILRPEDAQEPQMTLSLN